MMKLIKVKCEDQFSKNALAQAIRVAKPNIKQKDFFAIMKLPKTMTTTNRYWASAYNIRDWNSRDDKEKKEALKEAKKLISRHKF